MVSDHGPVPSHEGQQGAATGEDSCDVFQGYAQDFGPLDAGSRADFTSSRPLSLLTSVFHLSYPCMTCGLEKRGRVDQN